MRYYVEDWETGEVIKVFDSKEDRHLWLIDNVNENGYLDDGRKINAYDE